MLCSVPVLAVARFWLSSQFELLFVFGSGLVVRFVSLRCRLSLPFYPVLSTPKYIYAPMSRQVTPVSELKPRGGVVPYIFTS